MYTKRVAVACALGLFAVALARPASAATVVVQDDADFTTLPGSSFNPTWVSGSDVAIQNGEVPNVYRSPFENVNGGNGGALLSDGGYGLPGYQNLAFTSVQANGSAVYNVAGGKTASGISLLWGSPDSYNVIDFYSGLNGKGTLVDSITGSSLELQTYGHDQVSIATAAFESFVILSPGQNAFEYADLLLAGGGNLQPTPLPAALPLFAGGLGFLGYFARKRRRA
jgi:hypothetical protein